MQFNVFYHQVNYIDFSKSVFIEVCTWGLPLFHVRSCIEFTNVGLNTGKFTDEANQGFLLGRPKIAPKPVFFYGNRT